MGLYDGEPLTEKASRFIENHGSAIAGVLFGAACFLPFYWGFSGASKEAKRVQDVQRVAAVADMNKDNRTTTDEWAQVYRSLGIHFDEVRPRNLTSEECNNYLSSHR